MLEIISSRKNTDLNLPSEMQYLPEYVRSYHSVTTKLHFHDCKISSLLLSSNSRPGDYMKSQRLLTSSIQE